MDFESLWRSGFWRKTGKDEARVRFEKSVRTEQDWAEIQAARDAFNAYCVANPWYHAPMGSTWFGKLKGWKQWIPDRAEALEDDPDVPEWKTVHQHYCAGFYCGGPHEWTHTEDSNCGMGLDVICDVGFEKFKERKARQKRVETAV